MDGIAQDMVQKEKILSEVGLRGSGVIREVWTRRSGRWLHSARKVTLGISLSLIPCLKGTGVARLGGSVGEVSAFSSGHDPRVLGSRPALGSLLSRESASPSPSAIPHLLVLSLK